MLKCKCGLEYAEDRCWCPSCGAVNGPVRLNFSMGHDYDNLSPLTRQALETDRKFQERLILQGVRGDGTYSVEERGPNWLRPFHNDPIERKRAEEAYKAGFIKFEDHLPGVESQ